MQKVPLVAMYSGDKGGARVAWQRSQVPSFPFFARLAHQKPQNSGASVPNCDLCLTRRAPSQRRCGNHLMVAAAPRNYISIRPVGHIQLTKETFMSFVPPRPLFGIVAALISVVAVGVMVNAQPATQPKPAASNPAPQKPAAGAPAPAKPAPLTEEQQREALWNSPEMLRARAWVTDYCTNSKKMSPEEAKEYMTELEHLSSKQMKLWLLQYEHQQELYVQKESAQQVAHRAAMAHAQAAMPSAQAQQMWEMQHRAGLAQAMAADRATQQAYGAIESEETQAAGEEQSQLNAQEAASRQMQMNKQAELNNPYPIYGYGGGYGGPWGYGGGNYHFHFH